MFTGVDSPVYCEHLRRRKQNHCSATQFCFLGNDSVQSTGTKNNNENVDEGRCWKKARIIQNKEGEVQWLMNDFYLGLLFCQTFKGYNRPMD